MSHRAFIVDSPRVRALRADAIALVVHRRLGIDLSHADALRLAEGGSIALALVRLAERLRVRRAAPGVELGAIAQQQLAVAEVAAGLSDAYRDQPAEHRELVRRLVDREVKLHRVVDAMQAKEREIAAEMAHIERTEPRLRVFMRQAARLYSEQRAALDAHILDPDALRTAVGRLDAVYAEHIDLATTYALARAGASKARGAPVADDLKS